MADDEAGSERFGLRFGWGLVELSVTGRSARARATRRSTAAPEKANVFSAGPLILMHMRRRPGPAPRLTPAWNGGFAPPPAWLPFGESLTQTSGAGFVPDLPPSDEWTSSYARAPLSLVKTVVNTCTSWEIARKASPLWLLFAALTTMLGALALR